MDDSRSDDPPAGDDGGLGRRWQEYLDDADPADEREPTDRPEPGGREPEKGAGRGAGSRPDEALREAFRKGTPRAPDAPVTGPDRYRLVLVAAVIVGAPIGLFVLGQLVGGSDAGQAGSGGGGVTSELSPVADTPAASADSGMAEGGAGPGRTASGGDTASTPELLDLTVRGTPELTSAAGDGGTAPAGILSVPVGGEGVLRVSVRRAGGPAAGVQIVLQGSEALPAFESRLKATTDSAGSAAFRLPVGGRPDTLALDVLARGFWLSGANRIVLRVVP